MKWDAKNALFHVDWKPGVKFDYLAVRKQVRQRGGYTLKSATLVVEGSVAVQGEAATLTVSGTGQVFRLAPAGKSVEERQAYQALLTAVRAGGKGFEILGSVDVKSVKKAPKQPPRLLLQRFSPLGK